MNMPVIKANTSAVASLLGNIQVNTTQAGGTTFLSFDAKRTGEWTLGADKEPCTGDVFSLDVASLKHGYIQWHMRKANRLLVPINQPLPLPQEPIHYQEKGKEMVSEANEARSLEGTFSDGVRFTLEVSSFGGRKAVDGLITELVTRFAQQSPFLFPQVELASDSYDHASYGKVFTPELHAVAWFDAEGNEEGAPALAAPTKQAEVQGEQVRDETLAPVVRRRRA